MERVVLRVSSHSYLFASRIRLCSLKTCFPTSPMKLCGLLFFNLGSPVGSKSKLMATIKAIEEGALEMDRREDDRSTRESYKDKHKDKAFAMMKNAKSNLQLHHRPVERAQELFSAFRNAREKVQKENLVIAACLVLAHREVRVSETLTLSSASCRVVVLCLNLICFLT